MISAINLEEDSVKAQQLLVVFVRLLGHLWPTIRFIVRVTEYLGRDLLVKD